MIVRYLLLLCPLMLIACGGGSGDNSGTNIPVQDEQTVSGHSYAYLPEPELLQDNAGNTLMYWLENGILFYRYKATTGNWTAESQAPQVGDIQNIIKTNGSNFLLLGRSRAELKYAIFNNGQWSAVSDISLPAGVTTINRVALATNGTGYMLAMERISNMGRTIEYAQYSGAGFAAFSTLVDAPSISLEKLVSDNNGYAILSHQVFGPSTIRIYDGTNWSSQEFAGGTNLIANETGYLAVWSELVNASSALYASIYDTSAENPAWVDSGRLDSDAGSRQNLQIVSSKTSFLIAWYYAVSQTQNNLVARVYNGGWSVETPLHRTVDISPRPLSLKTTSNGTGFAVAWISSLGNNNEARPLNYYANIYDGVDWTGESVVTTALGNFNISPRLQLVSNGNNYAVYTVYRIDSATSDDMFVSVSNASNAWPTTPTVLGRDLLNRDRLVRQRRDFIGVADSRYTVFWLKHDGTGEVYTTKTQGDLAWPETDTILLTPSFSGSAIKPMYARNNAGTEVVVWVQQHGQDRQYFMNSRNGGSWRTAQQIEECNYYNTANGDIQVVSNGTDFMITCVAQGVNHAQVIAIPFDGSQQGTATPMGRYVGGHVVATNGDSYMVAWMSAGATLDLKVNFYVAGAFVGETVAVTDYGVYEKPSVASNGTNYAIAWNGPGNGQQREVLSSVYNAGNKQWTPYPVTTTGLVSDIKALANGNYAITWINQTLYASVFSNNAWSTGAEVQTNLALRPEETAFSTNNNDMNALWFDSNNFYLNRYRNSTWQEEVILGEVSGANDKNSPLKNYSAGNELGLSWTRKYGNVPLHTVKIYANDILQDTLTFGEDTSVSFYSNSDGLQLLLTTPIVNHSVDPYSARVIVSDPL